jgi:hypothetical protein
LGFPTTKTEEEKEDQGPAAASQSHVICTNSSSTHGFTSGLQNCATSSCNVLMMKVTDGSLACHHYSLSPVLHYDLSTSGET